MLTAVPTASPQRWQERLSALAATFAAIALLGSGLLDLLSLMGGPVPTEMPLMVRELFPLEFTGIARSVTLLTGFALVLCGFHLLRRKRLSYQLGVVLASISAVFHAFQIGDRDEAICSLLLVALLIACRKRFDVQTHRPDLREALQTSALALALTAAYGVLGFWLLEPAEFGRNFHWYDAAWWTLRLATFTNDGVLIPHTPYATWFLDSLHLLTIAALVSCGVVLFRPVRAHLQSLGSARQQAAAINEQYGRSAQDFFKQWPDKQLFFSPSGRTYLAYRVGAGVALVLGDPVGPAEETEPTVRAFLDYCRRHGWRVGFHQAHPDYLELYRSLGFRALCIGEDAIVDLTQFSLAGSAFKQFRNTITKLEKLGVTFERHEPGMAPELVAELRAVSDEWLTEPGHRERRFTLGRFSEEYVSASGVYLARDTDGRVLAFLNLVPCYRPEMASLDLMRRRREAPNGIMDLLLAKALLDLKQRGVERFSLGMAPLAGIVPVSWEERLVHALFRRFPTLFRCEGIRQYKAKYSPTWEPRYTVYRRPLDLPRLGLALNRVSELKEGA